MGTDEGSFVPSATYHLTGDGDDLDRFDPRLLLFHCRSPSGGSRACSTASWAAAWAKIEERHPDVVVSLSGAQQKAAR